MIWILAACGPAVTCGEGTALEDGACVAESQEGDADTDTDTDTDTE